MLKRHFRNASWGGFSAAFRAGYGLLNVLLSIRLLGVDSYGDIATLLAFFVFYVALNSSIFTVLVVKLMAKEENKISVSNNDASMLGMLFTFASILFLAAVIFIVENLTPTFLLKTIGFKNLLLAFAFLASIQILSGYLAALIEGSGRMDRSTKAQLLGPLLILISLFFAFILKLPVTALIYASILCIGALLDLCVILYVGRKNLLFSSPIDLSLRSWLNMWDLLKSGSLLQATSLMNMFLEPLNKFLLNSFLGASAVTFYELVMKLIWGIQSLFSASMRVFLHMADHDQEIIGKAYIDVIRLICVPALLLHTICALFLALISRYWLKVYELDLFIFFAIATFSNLGMIFVLPIYNYLLGKEDLLFIFKTQARLAFINLLASVTLIPIMGLIGAAFGLLLATLFNVLAIINRTKFILTFNFCYLKFRQVFFLKFIAAFSLFLVAIIWGCYFFNNHVLLIIICISILVMTIQEPIFSMLFKEFKRGVTIQGRV